jgi:hypothetical protein
MELFDIEDVVSRMYRWTSSSLRCSIDRGIFFSYSLIYNEVNNTGIWDRVFNKTDKEIVFYLKGFDYTKEDLERIVSHKQKCLQHYLKRKTIEKDF